MDTPQPLDTVLTGVLELTTPTTTVPTTTTTAITTERGRLELSPRPHLRPNLRSYSTESSRPSPFPSRPTSSRLTRPSRPSTTTRLPFILSRHTTTSLRLRLTPPRSSRSN